MHPMPYVGIQDHTAGLSTQRPGAIPVAFVLSPRGVNQHLFVPQYHSTSYLLVPDKAPAVSIDNQQRLPDAVATHRGMETDAEANHAHDEKGPRVITPSQFLFEFATHGEPLPPLAAAVLATTSAMVFSTVAVLINLAAS